MTRLGLKITLVLVLVGASAAFGVCFPHVVGDVIVELFQLDQRPMFKQPLPRNPKYN